MREVVNTSDWSLEQVSRYGVDITAALRKLVDRFPHDLTMESVRDELFAGTHQLWLLLDDGRFEACALTEVKHNTATDRKSVLLTQLAGEFSADLVPLVEAIEDWARSIGANDVRPVGRLGWRKALAKCGYDPIACYYRKELY